MNISKTQLSLGKQIYQTITNAQPRKIAFDNYLDKKLFRALDAAIKKFQPNIYSLRKEKNYQTTLF